MVVQSLASRRKTKVRPHGLLRDGTITIIRKGNRERRVFVPDEIKSLLNY